MNWRPIKTAPKDDHILLLYPSFSYGEPAVVGMGRWVDVPPQALVQECLFDKDDSSLIPPPPYQPHWEAAYVAIIEHGGRWSGHSYKTKSVRVEPTHWQPLPKGR